MLKSFIADLKVGLKWLAEEMSKPSGYVDPNASRWQASGSNKKLEPRRSRRPASAASPENNHDEDRHHHQAYDGDAFSSGSGSDGGGD